jgi:hypothetical protein
MRTTARGACEIRVSFVDAASNKEIDEILARATMKPRSAFAGIVRQHGATWGNALLEAFQMDFAKRLEQSLEADLGQAFSAPADKVKVADKS